MRKLCVVVALCLCASLSAGEGWKANLGQKFRSFIGIPERSSGAADIMHGYEKGTWKYNVKAAITVLSPSMFIFRVLFHEIRKDLQENYWGKR